MPRTIRFKNSAVRKLRFPKNWSELTLARHLSAVQAANGVKPYFLEIRNTETGEPTCIHFPEMNEPVHVVVEDEERGVVLDGMLPEGEYETEEGVVFSVRNRWYESQADDPLPICKSIDDGPVLTAQLREYIAAYSNTPLADINRLPVDVLEQQIAPALRFLRTPPTLRPRTALEHRGRRLVAAANFEDNAFGKWVLLERQTLPDGDLMSEQGLACIPALVAAVYHDEDEGFNDATMQERADWVESLPVPKALGAARYVLEGMAAVREKYAEIFKAEPAKNASERDWANYYQRWGWNAIMEDLGYAYNRDTERQAFYSESIRVILTDMAKRQSKSATEARDVHRQSAQASA
jgi:hypothetical protein